MKDRINIIVIFFIIIISRIAFIWNSPGIDPDNWRVLQTGNHIAETGVYEASRLPGYPVSEYLASLFGSSAWLVLNIFSVIFTALCCVTFYKILSYFNFKSKFFATLALGFVQAIFIASASNMEYTWSLFFLLLGLFLLLKNNFVFAGISLGLMVAIRFNNIVFLLPIIYFLYAIVKTNSLKNYILLYSILLLTFGLLFIPVFHRYSLEIFPNVGEDKNSVKAIISQYTLYVYGLLGLLAFIISGIYMFFYKRVVMQNFQTNKEVIIFSSLMIIMSSLVYFKFPFESNYNIPSVPFVLLILVILIESSLIKKLVFGLLIISPFLFYISSDKFQVKGSIFVNEKIEDSILDYTKSIHSEFTNITTEKKLLVAGGFYYCYLYKFPLKNKRITVLKRPTKEVINSYISKGYVIYYPSEIKLEIMDINHYDISKYGTSILKPLNLDR